MRSILVAFALSVSASAGVADISWHADQMGVGSVMIMQDWAGVTTHVKRGEPPEGHAFDMFSGEGRNSTFLGSYTTNAQGEVMKTVAADGAVTRYAPHRCTRTLGECSFTVTHADGFVEPRTRVTRAVRGGLQYQEFGLDGLMVEGGLKLDQIGAATEAWHQEAGRKKRRTKRILIALK
jgi:hypothetical protein